LRPIFSLLLSIVKEEIWKLLTITCNKLSLKIFQSERILCLCSWDQMSKSKERIGMLPWKLLKLLIIFHKFKIHPFNQKTQEARNTHCHMAKPRELEFSWIWF
jgi:hypothetical protein